MLTGAHQLIITRITFNPLSYRQRMRGLMQSKESAAAIYGVDDILI